MSLILLILISQSLSAILKNFLILGIIKSKLSVFFSFLIYLTNGALSLLGNIAQEIISRGVKSGGWWTFKREKIELSPADYWVLVLYQFQHRSFDFVIIRPSKLLSIYNSLNRDKNIIQSYIWVTSGKSPMCWETTGTNKLDQEKIAIGAYKNRLRNLTPYLNNWKAIESL